MTSFFVLAVSFAVSAADTEFHIQPYLQMPESGTIAVMWETTEPAVGELQFGTSEELGMAVSESEPRTVHEVRFPGLTPGAQYYYRVRSGERCSPITGFRAPPAIGTKRWRMVVYGDSRSFPERHRRVTELAASLKPDVVIHTGDQVTRGTQRAQWKDQFFDPAAPLFSRVPVLTSLGNHEEGAGNYYEYLALPGKEQYYSVKVGSAELIALDSNTWGSSVQESEQFAWLEERASRPRSSEWLFVFFHHPLFSAHDARSINRARWDLCPLFEDLGVDMVLTGHDHFYARSYPIGRLGAAATRGIPHLTTAGGGAPLYQLKQRSYSAVQEAVHHVTVMDFAAGEVHARAIDVDGRVLDEFKLTKEVSPPQEFCAYEVYELERAIREAIESRPPATVPENIRTLTLAGEFSVPHTFRIPLSARLSWQSADEPGTPLSRTSDERLEIQPGRPLVLPIRQDVQLAALDGRNDPSRPNAPRLPRLRLELAGERFRNREILFAPLKIWQERTVRSRVADNAQADPQLPEHRLVRAEGSGPAAADAYVAVSHTAESIQCRVAVAGTYGKAGKAESAVPSSDGSTLVKGHHVRVLIAANDHIYSFAVTPGGRSAAAIDAKWTSDVENWSATTGQHEKEWHTTVTLPRALLGTGEVRINVLHSNPTARVADCLSPTFDVGSDPDLVPDFRFGERSVERFARLVLEP